tara:strand:+ start:1961 stop:2722 length:762 start_codon:yes stop_codon:yes gene_type:complete
MNIKKFVRYKKNIDKKFNRENLISIANILDIDEYFVFYGTLLGLVREKDIIDNDDDIDILVDIKNRDKVISKIESSKLKIDYSNPYNETPYFLQISNESENTKSYVDVYFYENYKNLQYIIDRANFHQRWDDPSQSLHIPKKLIFPTKSEKFFNTNISFPNESIKICEFLYSKDWTKKLSKKHDYKILIEKNIPKIQKLKKIEFDSLSDEDKKIALKIQEIDKNIKIQNEKINESNKEKQKLIQFLINKQNKT